MPGSVGGVPAPMGGMPAPSGGDPAPMGGMPAPVGGMPAPVGGDPAPMRPSTEANVALLECDVTAAQLAASAGAAHQFSAVVNGASRVLSGNGIVNHDIGTFPNPGNPNQISPQLYSYTVPVAPAGAGRQSTIFGLALSGSVFDPGTAETWNDDPTWRYEALRFGTAPGYFVANGGTDATRHPNSLGLDCNNAHVQPTGAYHYHGIPTNMLPAQPALTQVGWAGDGYPIFAVWGRATPNDPASALVELRGSWQLKAGERPSGDAGPGGPYDGTFGADWEYVAGSGDLDECNGRVGLVPVDGQVVSTYHYMLTNTFPYVPRCWHAAPGQGFNGAAGGGMMPGGGGMMPGGGGMMPGQLPMCTPGQRMCCGDGVCGGPETAQNCAADC